jgi:hypothetical protein
MLSVLQKFAKRWVFNFEDDAAASLRLERELKKLNKEKNV